MSELTFQFLSVLTSRGLQKVLNAATIFLLARLLTVEDYGLYGLFLTTAMLASSFCSCGIRQAIAYFTGRNLIQESEIVASGLVLSMPLTMFSSVGTLVWLLMTRPEIPLGWAIPILCISFGLMLIQVAQGRNLGQGEINSFNLYETAPFAITLLGIGISSITDTSTVATIVYAVSLSYFMVGIFAIWKTIRDINEKLHFHFGHMSVLLKQGLPYALAATLALGNNTVSLYLMNMKGLVVEAGLFFMAWQFYNALLNVINALGVVFFSHGTRAKTPQHALRDVARLTSFLLWFMLVGGIAGALLAPWIIPFVLGSQYEPAVIYIQILLCAMPAASLSRLLFPTLGGVGSPYLSMLPLIPALLINICLSWFWLDTIGIMGSIAALIISQLVMATGYLFIVHRKFQLSPWPFLIPSQEDAIKLLSKTKRAMRFSKNEG